MFLPLLSPKSISGGAGILLNIFWGLEVERNTLYLLSLPLVVETSWKVALFLYLSRDAETSDSFICCFPYVLGNVIFLWFIVAVFDVKVFLRKGHFPRSVKNKSCTLILSLFLNGVIALVDKGNVMGVMYLDFSMTFNKVPQGFLVPSW